MEKERQRTGCFTAVTLLSAGIVAPQRSRFQLLRLPVALVVTTILASPALAVICPAPVSVATGSDLVNALAIADSASSFCKVVINFQNNITLGAGDTLPAINTAAATTINGNNFTLNGGGVQRGFFVYSGTVGINNLVIANAFAQGGAGGVGALGGGGGAGLGGGLFLASGADVSISNVAIQLNAAQGGGGGAAGSAGTTGGGGLGGAGGNGANADGGGGGVGKSATGGLGGSGNGGSGIINGAASGGAGGSGGGAGGLNGGGGGGAGPNNGGGGGGVGAGAGAGTTGGTGAFGGGGGGGSSSAGPGGFGGGGGGGGVGGSGGFGGGGGGGVGSVSGGGFGGGAGGALGSLSGAGGGGAGLGGGIFVQQGATLTLAGNLTVNGNTVTAGGSGGAGAGNGAAFGSGLFLNGNGTITFQPGSGQTQTVADGIADQNGSGGAAASNGNGGNGGIWNLTVNGVGKLVLSGTNTYSGATTVSAGTLEVDGTIANSSSVTVNAGGTLTGTGVVDPLTVTFGSGATFAPGAVGAPGTSMTIVGNLVLSPGSTYAVSLNPATSSFASIQGSAALTGATANASFASGSYVSKRYTILTTTGGLGGTTFASLTNSNLPAGFIDALSYDSDDVLLNLTAVLGQSGTASLPSGGLNQNQGNVASALNGFFNAGGTLTPNFVSVFGLTGSALQNGLTQLDGEAATGAAKGAFELTDQFLALMLDPFVDGRNGAGWFGQGGAGTQGFAPEQPASFPPDVALAYAGVMKAPPQQTFQQRWTAWGSAFGGSNTTDGSATIGSNTVTARDYGYAGGMDYHYSPDTVAGFALAGGGTNWGLAQGLGGGRSDAFQAGVYGVERFGPAYVAADVAFANHWMTTSRIALADQITASFNGQSYGGRVETGYRYAATPMIGVTPYAALQAQSFHTPRYNETDVTGGGFALSYNAMSATDTRSELGARFDDATMVGAMPLVLRARAAWAHDWISNPALNAVFQGLPGANFTVNGAAAPKNSALASAAADLHLAANWTLTAKFDGEFASGSQTYAGTGTLRYAW